MGEYMIDQLDEAQEDGGLAWSHKVERALERKRRQYEVRRELEEVAERRRFRELFGELDE